MPGQVRAEWRRRMPQQVRAMRRLSWIFLFAVLICGLWLPPAAAAEAKPTDVVDHVNDAILSAMRNAEDLGYQGRYDALARVLGESFYFAFMAQAAAGRHWSGFDETQKQRLAEDFERMSIASYASRFDGYSGQRFEVGETVQHPRGTVIVRNRLFQSDGKGVSIDYLLRNFEGRWRIIDIFLKGVISEIATKRSEYGSILEREGIDELFARLEAKVAELAA
ncbi:MAG: ABC transporter substrate-binding protein, partial [Kiloniellales bacterium]